MINQLFQAFQFTLSRPLPNAVSSFGTGLCFGILTWMETTHIALQWTFTFCGILAFLVTIVIGLFSIRKSILEILKGK
jgi:hypothetical protein